MKHFTKENLASMERIYRGNLINSITGFKSANLLATRSIDGVGNVAIFSSVTHLGSDPALFSFVQRPLGHGAGHTYKNLKDTGEITLNHVTMPLVPQAHQSSAKYEPHISEFEELGIEKQERIDHLAPFVKKAPVQIAARYENEYFIKENNCILVICRMTDVFLQDGIQHEDGWVDLGKAGTVAINGLDGYAFAKAEQRLSYAKTGKEIHEISMEIND